MPRSLLAGTFSQMVRPQRFSSSGNTAEDRETGQRTSGDAEWYYDSGAEFVEDYGANNPYDDFACVFALFFMHQHGDDYYADGWFESTGDLIDDISDDDDDADKWDLVSEYLASL